MKKQRLQKKQQQAKAGGPELTEAEVRVNANVSAAFSIFTDCMHKNTHRFFLWSLKAMRARMMALRMT